MRKQTFKFSKSATDIFFDLSITKLKEIVDVKIKNRRNNLQETSFQRVYKWNGISK